MVKVKNYIATYKTQCDCLHKLNLIQAISTFPSVVIRVHAHNYIICPCVVSDSERPPIFSCISDFDYCLSHIWHYVLIDLSSCTHQPLLMYSPTSPYVLIDLSLFTHRPLLMYSSASPYLVIDLSLITHRPLLVCSLTSPYVLINLCLCTHRPPLMYSPTWTIFSCYELCVVGNIIALDIHFNC